LIKTNAKMMFCIAKFSLRIPIRYSIITTEQNATGTVLYRAIKKGYDHTAGVRYDEG
jgi:hypothetical protein